MLGTAMLSLFYNKIGWILKQNRLNVNWTQSFTLIFSLSLTLFPIWYAAYNYKIKYELLKWDKSLPNENRKITFHINFCCWEINGCPLTLKIMVTMWKPHLLYIMIQNSSVFLRGNFDMHFLPLKIRDYIIIAKQQISSFDVTSQRL